MVNISSPCSNFLFLFFVNANYTFMLLLRIAVFSIKVLKDERIVIIAEQRPDCTEEEVGLARPRLPNV